VRKSLKKAERPMHKLSYFIGNVVQFSWLSSLFCFKRVVHSMAPFLDFRKISTIVCLTIVLLYWVLAIPLFIVIYVKFISGNKSFAVTSSGGTMKKSGSTDIKDAPRPQSSSNEGGNREPLTKTANNVPKVASTSTGSADNIAKKQPRFAKGMLSNI